MRAGSRPKGRLALTLLLSGGVSLAFGCSLVVKTDDLATGGGALAEGQPGDALGIDAPAHEDVGALESGDETIAVNDSAADASSTGDATTADTGARDAGWSAEGASDAGPTDTGAADTALTETGSPEAGGDTGTPDTGKPDTGVADAGMPETGSPSPCPTSARVFVTSASFTGDLGGLAGGDQSCTSAAAAAGLGGNWTAWLSDANTSALNRIYKVNGNGGYLLVNGTRVATNWASLVSKITPLLHQIDTDETGTAVPNPSEVWTGTDLAGGTPDGYCGAPGHAGWTSFAQDAGTPFVGLTNQTTPQWSNAYMQFCDRTTERLYCFERCQ